MAEAFYVYLLLCKDDSYYCGYTVDIERRVMQHNAGKGAKYTRSRLPVRLVYIEQFETKQEAMSREWHLKRLSHKEKQALVNQYCKEVVKSRENVIDD